ncbi:MAG TPA: AAA-like domain-containing protein [Polyangium sp.]|nr:AAA-like domain-containing protein [Polyangium sp.]
MRHFSSYGPVEAKAHFAVERRELVDRCVAQLLGQPDEAGGHYFTIWGPRQTGKTWIMRQAIEKIRERYGDKYIVGKMSMQGAIIDDRHTPEELFRYLPNQFDLAFKRTIARPSEWDEFAALFKRETGLFGDARVILLIDEFDSLRPDIIDKLVSLFRDMYLARDNYVLHGLALIGVRSVLGLDSPRGSPFNVQRSLQIPNLTRDEVIELFRQYQSESGQVVEPNVVAALYESTRGQPGLVSWFGELLTEKYNPGPDKPIALLQWHRVYQRALQVEWNNTLLNLGKKARGPYRAEVMKLFTDPNVAFALEQEWCSFLYMNGIIDEAVIPDPGNDSNEKSVCRFSSPFVQHRLYSGLTYDMFKDKGPLPPIPLLDGLDDVFTPDALCVPPLLERYRDYLKRLKENGIDPWIGQPRRQDLHYTEAVGQFHLYAWLKNALGDRCGITPEFPTGNGKVDLLLRASPHQALIEVKSFTQTWQLQSYREQAAGYAKKLGLSAATVVVFAPTSDDAILAKLSSEMDVDGVRVSIIAFGWV